MTPTSAISAVPAQHCVRGFTLLELVIVLAILAMGSLLVIPSVTGLNARTFNAQVREVTSLLNYSRRNAVVTGQPAIAALRAARLEEAVTVASAAAPASRPGIEQVLLDRGVTLSYLDSTSQRSEVEDVLEVTFFPEGGSTGGEIILRQGERQAVITVDPFSGAVSTEFPDD